MTQEKLPRYIQSTLAYVVNEIAVGNDPTPQSLALLRGYYEKRDWELDHALANIGAQLELTRLKAALRL